MKGKHSAAVVRGTRGASDARDRMQTLALQALQTAHDGAEDETVPVQADSVYSNTMEKKRPETVDPARAWPDVLMRVWVIVVQC